MPQTGNKILLKWKITDEAFTAELPESYDLFIYAGSDEFSCTVAERAGKKFVALESWHLVADDIHDSSFFEDLRNESTLLSLKGYRRIICCTEFGNATLVPNPLFDTANAADQLNFGNHPHTEGQLIIDRLHQIEASNISIIPDTVFTVLSRWFELAEFHHTSTAIIDFLLTVNRNSREELLTVIVHKSFIEVIVTQGRELLLCNQFKYESPEEFVYYLLFVCEQLHLNPDNIRVQLAGDIYETDTAFQLATKYIRNTFLASRPDSFTYGSEFQKLPSQLHFNLFTQIICAS